MILNNRNISCNPLSFVVVEKSNNKLHVKISRLNQIQKLIAHFVGYVIIMAYGVLYRVLCNLKSAKG